MNEMANIFYKGERTPVPLPEGWRVVATGEPKPVKPLTNIAGELCQALNDPISMPSLAQALKERSPLPS